jgi:DNA-binding GntR family transcriptional regulator
MCAVVKIAADAANADHVSSVTRAFNELRELIVRGQLPPGGWIIESVLAERLGVSRTPVRSALHWLRREGYVVELTKNATPASSSRR